MTCGHGLTAKPAFRSWPNAAVRCRGHVMFSRGLLDAPARLVAVEILSPVGVRPHAQGNGIATASIRRGLEILSTRRVPAIFLEGDPGFYSRFGFVPAGAHGFRKPSLRIPDAAFSVAALPAHEPWMTGTLVYPEPFWRHDLVGLRDIKSVSTATMTGRCFRLDRADQSCSYGPAGVISRVT